ncbi:hypothetical protein Tco_0060880 [Tanacetum coccineum]
MAAVQGIVPSNACTGRYAQWRSLGFSTVPETNTQSRLFRIWILEEQCSFMESEKSSVSLIVVLELEMKYTQLLKHTRNEEIVEQELKQLQLHWQNDPGVDTADSNVTPDYRDMCDNDIQDAKMMVECDDEQEMHADLKYVESLEDELDELESDKAEFSNMYDMLLQECVSKDVMCSYLQSSSDLDEITELQCLYLHKVRECTEFLNKTLNAFFKEEGIEHQTSTPRTPEQNMKEKGDSCILVGYPLTSKGYRVYNKRTQLIVESIHLRFDEIKEISETSVANDTSGLVLQRQTASDYDNPDPAPELQNVFLQRYNSSHQTGLKVLLRKRVLISKESFAQLSSLGGCQDFAEGYVDNQYGLLIPDHPDKVYGLRKALYGLKQAREGLLDVKSRTVLTMSSAELEYVGVICTLCSGNVDAGTASRFHGFNSTRYRLYCDFSVSHLGNIMQPRAALPTEYQLADMFTKALPEDRFQYLVRQIGMRCLTPAELESMKLYGNNAVKIEITLEQSNNGVCNRTSGYIKMEDGDALFSLKSNSLPHAHAQSTKTFYKHQDSRIMKAQELKTKTSAQTLIYKIFLQRYQVYQGRLLASFQDDAKYEHVGQDTRSQGGKDDQDKQGKDLKISDIKTKSKDNDKGSRSKITKHEGTSLQRIQRPRPQDLNDKSNLIDLMKECHNELTSGEIVSLKILSRTMEVRS